MANRSLSRFAVVVLCLLLSAMFEPGESAAETAAIIQAAPPPMLDKVDGRRDARRYQPALFQVAP